ncbi:hypothetical protein FA13DRAFT_1031901 [Coprinellus micaceus]|uniref:Uncharacterized protein n=1 Tax=Coprinellus micaceus TaxID=71717 RepID=A0A4Y7RNV6_COPMI|nr:hypothetical protein FA13DRAFT_1031901 [Coprinellus micaceus]
MGGLALCWLLVERCRLLVRSMREGVSRGRRRTSLDPMNERGGFNRKGEGGKRCEEGVLAGVDGWSATRLGVLDDGSFVVASSPPFVREAY